MSSLIPGYEYDVFISYRQNDNRSGWVTEFVKSLKDELATIVKDPISIYFDQDVHDGLHETHSVKESLDGKLKSFIFIPIISQTYCDPRGYAWSHEFIVFHDLATKDAHGIKLKTAGSNVSSRIIPARIHDIDPDDISRCEQILDGPLRGVDFIYRTGTIARPLRLSEVEPRNNKDGTFYQDQVAKVARAVKDLLATSASTTKGSVLPSQPAATATSVEAKSRYGSRSMKLALAAVMVLIVGALLFFTFTSEINNDENTNTISLAILPFDNMNNDSTQDYFVDGIAEDILNNLLKVSKLNVKSRTSTTQYKKTTKSAKTIANELNVGHLLAGSVRRVDGKVRIVIQLINAATDSPVWSETYDRDLKDILTLQSNIAIEVAQSLNANLSTKEQKQLQTKVTKDFTAYDYYMKARDLYYESNWEQGNLTSALLLLDSATSIDDTFADAYALKSKLWYALTAYGVPYAKCKDSALLNAAKALEMNPGTSEAYVTQANILRFEGKIDQANKKVEEAFKLNPQDTELMNKYGVLLLDRYDKRGADLVLRSIEKTYSSSEPDYFLALSWWYQYTGDFASSLKMVENAYTLGGESLDLWQNYYRVNFETGKYREALNFIDKILLKNQDPFFISEKGWTHFLLGEYQNAANQFSKYKELEAALEDTSQILPFRHRLAMCYSRLGKKKEADILVQEDLQIRLRKLRNDDGLIFWENSGSLYYDIAADLAYQGKEAIAVQYLDSAMNRDFYYPWGIRHDPMFDNLRHRADFKQLQEKWVEKPLRFYKEAVTESFQRLIASKQLLRNSL